MLRLRYSAGSNTWLQSSQKMQIAITRWHAMGMYKDYDVEGQWKRLKIVPRRLKTPEPMVTKIFMREYVKDRLPTAMQNFITIRLWNFATTYS